MNLPRTVITGLGAASPLGIGRKAMWSGLCGRKCGISRIEAFDPEGFSCKLAGRVPDYRIQQFVPKSYRKAVKLFCRDVELSVMAAHEAVGSGGIVTKGLDPENVNIDPARMAINLGAGLISCDLVELADSVAKGSAGGSFDIRKWARDGFELITPLWLLKYLPNMLACHIGIIHDIQGPSNTIMCAEAAAHLAIIEACRVIQRGAADAALAGGAEAKVNPIVMMRQCLLGRTTGRNDDPAAACRPFDADAAGCVFGEGAGIVVLEDQEHAALRGARPFAEIAGTGQSTGLNPDYTHLEPDGKGLRMAIEEAIDEAGIRPQDLDLVVPHGTGIPADDRAEAAALEAALGGAARTARVWPTKSMLSNTGAAAGALDLIAAVCAMTEGRIPAAKNCDRKAEGCNLNIVKEQYLGEIRNALCCSYTYGGQTAAIVLKKWKE
jgi:3-oxoacyl-[acyl-carrier-protein] synthase II